LEALINAALAVLSSSSSQGAGVQQTFLHVSDKAPSQHVTSHSRYLGLLQAAADTTGARSTQPVRAGWQKPAQPACCSRHGAEPGACKHFARQKCMCFTGRSSQTRKREATGATWQGACPALPLSQARHGP
jgi:hypothetical protein